MDDPTSRADMSGNERSLITLHGAAVLLVGLVCGLAAVAEEVAGIEPPRWRAAHAALFMAGVWLLATAYAFTTAILVQALAGVRVLGPDESFVSWVVFAGNILTVGGGLLAALLTVLGAAAALKRGA